MTLSMSCSSDEIHDILLNNLPSSKNVNLPPFRNAFNLECYADDDLPQLSDNIEELFSIRREPEPESNRNAQQPLPQLLHVELKSSQEGSQTEPLFDQHLEQEREEEPMESFEPTTSSGLKRKMV